ncbi:MAG: hypothetical protein SF052_13005 [Bacteroidia bacterium]|nr:hypothetical protein [Bacteroidia bacterium]
MQITGKITFINLSGGFWGILGDDGQNYNPGNSLPAGFQKEGVRVKAKVSSSQAFSIFMWGTNVDIQKIEVI